MPVPSLAGFFCKVRADAARVVAGTHEICTLSDFVFPLSFMAVSLSIAASAVAAASLGYRGVSELILDEQLAPHRIARVFACSARGIHGRRQGADRELALVVLCSAVVGPESEWDTVIALAERACGGRAITALISEAGKLVRAHWDEIIDLASTDEAAAA